MDTKVNNEIEALTKRVEAAELAATEAEQLKTNIIASQSSLRPTGSNTNSDEARCLRYFGCRSAKDLLAVNTGDPRFSRVPDELKFLVAELKSDFDVSRMVQQIVHGENPDRASGNPDHVSSVKGILDGNYFGREILAPKLKAFGTGVTGAGVEWVPTIVSSQYIEEFELNRQVAAQFKQIRMPSSPFDMPVQTDVTVARRQVESCDPADNIASTNFGTGKITLEAEKLVEFMCLPEELNEDSAPQILALTRSEVTEAQIRAHETAILNGDSAAAQDSDTTSVVDARTSWDGLRKLGLANSANGSTVDFLGAAVTLAKARAMRTAMGKFGVNVRDLMWILSPKVYNQFLDIPEVTTVEKFGNAATVRTGALAMLDGIPLIITEYNRDDLNASGVYDGVTTDLSEVKLVNASRFFFGTRRPMRVRVTTDPTPPGDRWLLASWWRGDFQGHAQSATEVSVVQGFNVL